MKATKNLYSCQECGTIHKKWAGKCPDCGAWNSLIEEYESGGFGSQDLSAQGFNALSTNLGAKDKDLGRKGNKIELLSLESGEIEIPRVKIGINEFDRVLGGGLVPGSAILIGGDPGIGKSTLLIQVAASLANQNKNVFYISGEESVDQVRLRAKRLGLEKANVKLASSTNIFDIIKTIDSKEKSAVDSDLEQQAPTLVIIDSIQTMYVDILSSAPGTVSQVRACAGELTILAKRKNISLVLVSHVTKDGQIAGPKVLEHMVDTVLYFEGDSNHQFRIIRAIKNRFGSAGEIGVFEMNDYGLAEVNNPSQLFLSSREAGVSGSAVFAGMEGTRPILVEIQALVAPSFLPTPRRAVVGWDLNRLAMIIAVLNSRFGLNLGDKEVYLNVAGGLKVNEPAADMAVALALISAFKDVVLPPNSSVMGEVGLSGEVRMVSHIDVRLKEAVKLGFKNLIIPAAIEKMKNWPKIKKDLGEAKIFQISHVRDLAQFFRNRQK